MHARLVLGLFVYGHDKSPQVTRCNSCLCMGMIKLHKSPAAPHIDIRNAHDLPTRPSLFRHHECTQNHPHPPETNEYHTTHVETAPTTKRRPCVHSTQQHTLTPVAQMADTAQHRNHTPRTRMHTAQDTSILKCGLGAHNTLDPNQCCTTAPEKPKIIRNFLHSGL